MIYTNTELYQWPRIYTQKNVYSIISVNCLLDLMSLPYFDKILSISHPWQHSSVPLVVWISPSFWDTVSQSVS